MHWHWERKTNDDAEVKNWAGNWTSKSRTSTLSKEVGARWGDGGEAARWDDDGEAFSCDDDGDGELLLLQVDVLLVNLLLFFVIKII